MDSFRDIMPPDRQSFGGFKFKPVTLNEWKDMQALFSQMGSLEGCWCMYWRRPRSEFNRQFGEGNKGAMGKIIRSGEVPGILAYHGGNPVAWCSVAPREAFPVLDRSPTLRRVDDKPVWSIVCFFVAKPYRGEGMTEALIREAIEYAKSKGARIIEAYPVIPENSRNPRYEFYTGVASTFERVGFEKVSQRSKIRVMMRYYVNEEMGIT